jgi:hypothetical protein
VSLTGLAFLMAFAAGIGLAVLRHPMFGLYTYIAVFYLHPPSRWWGETLPDMRWSLLAAAVTLIVSWRLPPIPGRQSWLSTTPGKVLTMFTLWLWLQNLWALEPEAHLEASFLFTKYVVLYYLIYRLAVTARDMQRFLLVHVAGCAFLGWLAFGIDVSGRLEGVGGPGIDEANAFAMQMATAVAVAAMIALASGGWRWFAIIVLPFILNGVILSGSRGGFLALVGGGMVLWYLKPKEYRKLFYAFAALGVVLMGILAHDMFWERMGTIEAAAERDEAADTSALSRFALVDAQFRMFKSYPHGTGHRGTATLSPRYLDERFLSGGPDESQERRRSSHNTFMTALTEQGIPGAIFYVWVWSWCALTALRLKRNQAFVADPQRAALLASVAAGLVIVLVAGVFVDYIKAEVQIWLSALLASLAALAAQPAAEPTTAMAANSAARPPPVQIGDRGEAIRPAGRK